MTTLLQIQSSLFSADGQSSQLTNEFVSAWQRNQPASQIKVRDLALSPLPHINAEQVTAFFTPSESRTAAQQKLVDLTDDLINELKHSDIIVIGMPMYNFGIPSTLKAYFDHIARAGVTFRYTENGPVGLLTGKKAYIFATRGGQYAGTALDTQTTYVRDFLGFLGITDVEFIYAEGMNMGTDIKEKALAEVKRKLDALAA
ncbi:FMN-dependent NADH-azoreductase [Methylicorpusculum oleiharenae]|uniref:FMN-dependent NADH-azoreductase n=1 Tax=Methylicorpusculum oleiharenae TaxID=1338687 RepID=UPI0013582472|nr:FMN-dependent NADH-azoreductase [Methylicorpusculum oleiharenae]MCD2453421.1 FMN-dependent NADH-azoreductase [Methylicorpusculum oleiharenae]